jgi:hypothetical protein
MWFMHSPAEPGVGSPGEAEVGFTLGLRLRDRRRVVAARERRIQRKNYKAIKRE